MKIALTGATGFLGRYLLNAVIAQGHTIRAWARREAPPLDSVTWIPGELNDDASGRELVKGCDAIIHAALYHPSGRFSTEGGSVPEFVERNLLGTLRLIEAARAGKVERFVFISTCAVHDKILTDRPLDETHPLWPASHYGAHKAALEKFVHSYGYGGGYEICSLRPTGIYGVASPAAESKWYRLVSEIADGREVVTQKGGKEVHAADVAKAALLLLSSHGTAGQAYNCYDRYISEFDVATIAKRLSGSPSLIRGEPTAPKHQIDTAKLRALGMQFGGDVLLEKTISELLRTTGQ